MCSSSTSWTMLPRWTIQHTAAVRTSRASAIWILACQRRKFEINPRRPRWVHLVAGVFFNIRFSRVTIYNTPIGARLPPVRSSARTPSGRSLLVKPSPCGLVSRTTSTRTPTATLIRHVQAAWKRCDSALKSAARFNSAFCPRAQVRRVAPACICRSCTRVSRYWGYAVFRFNAWGEAFYAGSNPGEAEIILARMLTSKTPSEQSRIKLRLWAIDSNGRTSELLTRIAATVNASFGPCLCSRPALISLLSSAPFPLFPRVIRPPVFSRSYSGTATLVNLIHKYLFFYHSSPRIAERSSWKSSKKWRLFRVSETIRRDTFLFRHPVFI